MDRPLRLAARAELVRGDVLDANADDPVALDRGVSDAARAGGLSPRAQRRRDVAGAVLLAGGLHAALALSRRDEPAAPDPRHAEARADPRRRRGQLHHE